MPAGSPRPTLRPDPHRAAVSVEFFHRGEGGDDGFGFLHARAVILHDARAALEVGDAQTAEEASGAAGREHVAGAGDEIAECGRRVVADHDRTGGRNGGGELLRGGIGHEKFKMLGRDVVRDLGGVGEVLDLDGQEAGFEDALGLFAPRDQLDLGAQLDGNRRHDLGRGAQQIDLLPTGTVLCLGEEIGGGERRVGRLVGDDHDLARAGQRIDADGAKNLAFRFANVGVAGAEDLVDGVDRRRAIGHRADRLHATETVDFRHAREVQRGEHPIGQLAVGIAGREHRDFRTPGDFRQRDGHQHGRNERHLTARDVKADAADGVEFFADEGAVFVLRGPVFGEAAAVELDDAVAGGLEGPKLGGGQAFRGGGEIGRFHRKIAGAELGTVEFGGVVTDGFIPADADIGEDGGDGIGDFLRDDGPAAEGGQLVGKGFRSVMKRAHERTP